MTKEDQWFIALGSVLIGFGLGRAVKNADVGGEILMGLVVLCWFVWIVRSLT